MSAYSDKVLADGASHYWRLDETSGTSAANAAAAGAPGTIAAGVTLNLPGVVAGGSKAMLFNGTTGQIKTTAGVVFTGATAISFEAWVNNPAWAMAGTHEMVVGVGGQGVYLSVQDAKPIMSIHTGTQLTCQALATINANQWYHLVATWVSGSAIKLYVNGAEVANNNPATRTGALSTAVDAIIGAFNPTTPSLWYSGSLDDVAIYPTALTSAQVAEHYQLGLPKDYADRVSADGASYYWRLAEVSGATAFPTLGSVTLGGLLSVAKNQPGPLPGDVAMVFNGNNALSAANVAIPVTASVEVWARQLATVSGYAAILSTRDVANTAGNLFIGLNDGGFLEVLGTGGATITGTKVLRDGTWHHLVVTLTATTAALYVDGVLDRSAAFARATANPLPLGLGWDPSSGGLNWNGGLDEPAIYPTTLNATQVAAHFAAAASTVADFLRAPWFAAMGDDMGMDAYNVAEGVTPSDTKDLPRLAKGLWVGGGGNVAAVLGTSNVPVTFTAVPAGAWLPIAARRVNATGTTATGLIALYSV